MALEPSNPRRQGTAQKIDKLQEELYSRGAPEITKVKHEPVLPANENVNEEWKQDQILESELESGRRGPPKTSFFTKIFFISIAFFVVAAGIATYVLLGGFNVISSKNVDISVEGPIAVAAGEELVLNVTISNNNNAALEELSLFIEYPPGTRVSGDIAKELVRDRIEFEPITAGTSETKAVRAVLFGEKDSVREIKMTADYKARGSNASFSKEKTYEIAIKSSPIILEVLHPKEVNAGQEITFSVDITSNSTTLIRNLLLRIDYPFGFNFETASPGPVAEERIWRIGDFSPGEKRTIVIRGKIEGQNEEERTFRFSTGIAKENDENQIGVGFFSLAQTILIKKPFVTLGVKLNESSDKEYFARTGDRINGRISVENNLLTEVGDAEILVRFSGAALDRDKVSAAQGGFYRSTDNTITWNKNGLPSLAQISPSGAVLLNFNFNTLASSPQLIASAKNLQVLLDISLKGKRVTESGGSQAVSSSLSRLVKIETNLAMSGRTLFWTGPFANTGAIPPKAEKITTYTITWTLSNTFNDVAGASVSAALPQYVKWLGVVSPASSDIIYNDSNRTVVWNAGEVKAGSGFASPAREVSFKISLEPSLGQVGTTPELVQNIVVNGTDRFTDRAISEAKPPLTTRMSTEPNFETGDETVIK